MKSILEVTWESQERGVASTASWKNARQQKEITPHDPPTQTPQTLQNKWKMWKSARC